MTIASLSVKFLVISNWMSDRVSKPQSKSGEMMMYTQITVVIDRLTDYQSIEKSRIFNTFASHQLLSRQTILARTDSVHCGI